MSSSTDRYTIWFTRCLLIYRLVSKWLAIIKNGFSLPRERRMYVQGSRDAYELVSDRPFSARRLVGQRPGLQLSPLARRGRVRDGVADLPGCSAVRALGRAPQSV